jgi:hypothetical protein
VPPSITIPRQGGSPPFLRTVRPVHLLGVAAVAVVLLLGSLLAREPHVVDRMRLVNPSEYDVRVEVRGDSGGWSVVGFAERESTTAVEQVGHQGDGWTFRFTGQGRAAGELRMSRRQLEAADWRLEIPPSVAEVLKAQGVPPPP